MSNERIQARGRFDMLREDLKKNAVIAGSQLDSLREKTNTLIGDDFLAIDFTEVKALVESLANIQRESKNLIADIEKISKTYGFEFPGLR